MSGYTPLFSSLTTGTLCGRWPDIGLWPIVLSMCDKNGLVDVTPQYISGVTGLAVDEVIACMKRFCEPDPYSRSGAESGARLVLVDDHRDWGWRVVNHGFYREKARKQMQQIQATESGRDAERKRVERERKSSGDVQPRPAMSSADRLSDSDSDSDKKQSKRALRATRVPKDFSPDLDFARSLLPDIDAETEAQRFRDHEFAKAKSDWPGVWRNWVRTCKDRGQYARRSSNGLPAEFAGYTFR